MRIGFTISVITAAHLSLVASQAGAQSASPRTPDGKPDLQGIWQVLNTASWDIQDHHARLAVPGGQSVVVGNEIPYQPAALAKKLKDPSAEVRRAVIQALGVQANWRLLPAQEALWQCSS